MSWVDFSSGWLNYIDTLPDIDHQCWADSLVEYLMKAGLYLMRHVEPMPFQDKPVHRILQLTGSEAKALESGLWEAWSGMQWQQPHGTSRQRCHG